jgi:hypothetical protein
MPRVIRANEHRKKRNRKRGGQDQVAARQFGHQDKRWLIQKQECLGLADRQLWSGNRVNAWETEQLVKSLDEKMREPHLLVV